ncbi:MAG: hypothetical protein EBX52_10620 [Proteobacteria bacterium]|nr:hypothetical protein [Pseudomonadota bacterium]
MGGAGVARDGLAHGAPPEFENAGFMHPRSKVGVRAENAFQDFFQKIHREVQSWQRGANLSKFTKMRLFILVPILALLPACGYTLRGNTRVFFENHQIRTLYVSPVKNNSFKAGVEIMVYNALRKRVAQGGYVRIVDSRNLADGELVATVLDASYSPAGITTTDQIAPIGSGPKTVQIASEYSVNLSIGFQLLDLKSNKSLWADSVSRSKSFSASTYLGALGTTSALINESDYERSLSELSNGIVMDAEESMNSTI